MWASKERDSVREEIGGDAALEETAGVGMEHLSTRELPRLSWIDTLYSSTYTSSFLFIPASLLVCESCAEFASANNVIFCCM